MGNDRERQLRASCGSHRSPFFRARLGGSESLDRFQLPLRIGRRPVPQSGWKATELEKPFEPLHLLCLPLLLAACQNLPSAEPAPSTVPPRGQDFAQASCSGCHAVGLYGSSPNPNAPPFGAIANQEGLTAETLSTWLRGAHNYPREMDFYLSEQEVDALVAYMLTLRDPNYRRPPD